MKKIFVRVLPFFLFFTCLAAQGHGSETPWDIKLPFNKATIYYTVDGTEKGTETLYIKDHGKYQARYHDAAMSIMGITSRTNTVEITDPEWISTYDLEEQSGTKIANPVRRYKEEFNKLSGAEKKNVEKNVEELGLSMIDGMGGETTKKGAKILGYDCDVTKVQNMTTIYILSGTDVLLRSDSSIMGITHRIEATEINTTAAIDDQVFLPPKGIAAVHDRQADAMMQQMIENMMAQLKQSDGAERIRSNPQMMMPADMQNGGPPQQDQPPSPQNNQEMMESMQQGIDALKGLFGN